MVYRAVVIGASSGGFIALKNLLPHLPGNFGLPVIIVLHLNRSSENHLIEILNECCRLITKEAEEKEIIEKGKIYFAPPGYHMMVERDETFSISADEKVNFARPSIDVLFESAAEVYRQQLIGIILTGANNDGAKGLKKIKDFGGLELVQDTKTAFSENMPAAAINATGTKNIMTLENIKDLLINTNKKR